MSRYHVASHRAAERRADLGQGSIESGSGIRADMYAQKSPKVARAKAIEGKQSITDKGRTTLRNTSGQPIGAPNLKTEKIVQKKRKK